MNDEQGRIGDMSESNAISSLKDICAQVEKITDTEAEQEFSKRKEPEESALALESSSCRLPDTHMEVDSPPDNIQLLDIDDGSSSINRVLSWDPWAKLNIMKHDLGITSSLNENIHQSHQAESTGLCLGLASSHSAAVGPASSILKSSPRRVCSEVANTTCSSPKSDNRLELLPIGDTVAGRDSAAPRRKTVKHVQWHSEVQVIYYTGDTDGGVVLSTQVEPLHEEADQQARSIQYAREGAKNLSAIPTLENWFPQLTINK